MSFLLTLIGVVLFAAAVAGVAFGAFMATDPKTRRLGGYFALWWVPAVAAAGGVILQDGVTFVVGLACFAVAGLVFAAEAHRTREAERARRVERRTGRAAQKTTAQNPRRGSRRRAS